MPFCTKIVNNEPNGLQNARSFRFVSDSFFSRKDKMFTPRKCGVKFDPPTLVVFYEINLTGKASNSYWYFYNSFFTSKLS